MTQPPSTQMLADYKEFEATITSPHNLVARVNRLAKLLNQTEHEIQSAQRNAVKIKNELTWIYTNVKTEEEKNLILLILKVCGINIG